ncbi:MAG: NAD-dependent epimerase/dehydratase family protein [Solirubrobacterales bacterium]
MREIDQRRFLITGGAGFIGSHLVDALVAAGARVAVLDDLSTGRRENIGHHLSAGEIDFTEASAVERDLVRALVADADVVVHLASAVGVQLVIGNPLETLLRNIRSADVVTEACADLGARLIFASTSEIYGKVDSPDPLDEGSDLIVGSPQTARWGYAAAKMVGEMMAYGYHRAGAAEAIVVRFFNTVGPRQTGVHGMVVPRLTGQALAGDDLTVYGDGRQLRCFTHVADAVDALLRLAVAPDSVCGRPFNIGNRDNEVTILELARMIIERSGSRSGVNLIPFDAVFGEGFEELGRRRPDTDALQRATGWQPSRTITEIVDDVVADMTAVPSGFERLLPARGGEPLEA